MVNILLVECVCVCVCRCVCVGVCVYISVCRCVCVYVVCACVYVGKVGIYWHSCSREYLINIDVWSKYGVKQICTGNLYNYVEILRFLSI